MFQGSSHVPRKPPVLLAHNWPTSPSLPRSSVWPCDWGQWEGAGNDVCTPLPGQTHRNLLQERLLSLPLSSAGSWCPAGSGEP